jgi:hypothetical protein
VGQVPEGGQEVSYYRELEDPDYVMQVYVWDGDAEALADAWGGMCITGAQGQEVWVHEACVLRNEEAPVGALARLQGGGCVPVFIGDALLLDAQHVAVYRAELLDREFVLVPDDELPVPMPALAFDPATF